jgi:hypothetical protein
MKTSVREALWFHLLFFALSAPVLLFAKGGALGQGLLILVILYNIALPTLSIARGHSDWLRLWLFLLPLSCGQVLPDWALVEIPKVLVFPDHGQYRIGGAVPMYFMGLWMILLFPILLISDASRRSRYLLAALLSLALFSFWEWAARPLGLWYGQNVAMLHGVALYTLVPEVLLTLVALSVYRRTEDHSLIQRLFSALGVNLFYAGSLFISLLLSNRYL